MEHRVHQENRRVSWSHRLEYSGFRLARFVCRILPLWAARALGSATGWFLFGVVRARRAVALDNLAYAFPDMPERERAALGYAAFRQVARSGAEFLRLSRRPGSRPEGCVRFVGMEHVRAGLGRGKGVILASAHFGCWELGAAHFARTVAPLHVVALEQKNMLVDEFVRKMREGGGVQTIPRGSALRGILSALRKGDAVAILIDQNARHKGVPVEFFGRPVSTYTGPARIAARTGAPLVPGFDVRYPDGSHTVYFEEPIYVESAAEQHLLQTLRRLNSILESYVRRYPDHWLWGHRRWRVKPEWFVKT